MARRQPADPTLPDSVLGQLENRRGNLPPTGGIHHNRCRTHLYIGPDDVLKQISIQNSATSGSRIRVKRLKPKWMRKGSE